MWATSFNMRIRYKKGILFYFILFCFRCILSTERNTFICSNRRILYYIILCRHCDWDMYPVYDLFSLVLRFNRSA